MVLFISVVTAFIISIVLTKFVKDYALNKNIMDIPNERSSHVVPTPRGGGVAIVVAVLCSWFGVLYLEEASLFLIVGIPSFLIASLGWFDDRYNLSARCRFLFQIVVATVCSYFLLQLSEGLFWRDFGLWELPLVVTIVFCVLFIGWMTNLYNFMDGIDGITSMQTISVCFLSALFAYQFSMEIFAIYLIIGFSCLGFLYWNWSPAKIFMGDVGSSFLGFILAAVAVASHVVVPKISLRVMFIIHGVFLVDATYTLFRRLLTGEVVYQAHRDHAYQHAVQRGFSHKTVSLFVLLVNICWLGPLAWLAMEASYWHWWWVVWAYTPLVVLQVYFRAGVRWFPDNNATGQKPAD